MGIENQGLQGFLSRGLGRELHDGRDVLNPDASCLALARTASSAGMAMMSSNCCFACGMLAWGRSILLIGTG